MLDNGHISVKLEKVQIHGMYVCERTLILIIDEVTRNGVWFSKREIQGAFSPFSIEVPIKWYFRPNINLLTQMHLKIIIIKISKQEEEILQYKYQNALCTKLLR